MRFRRRNVREELPQRAEETHGRIISAWEQRAPIPEHETALWKAKVEKEARQRTGALEGSTILRQ